jgi:probable HAF family extracellular repeat protein
MYGVPIDLDDGGNVLIQPASAGSENAVVVNAQSVTMSTLPHGLNTGRLYGDAKVVVGSTPDVAGSRAIIFDGAWTDLNSLLCSNLDCWANDSAVGMDVRGRIAGNRYSLSTRLSGYTVSPTGVVSTLTLPGAVSTRVADINSRGDILVQAVFGNAAYERGVIISISGEPTAIAVADGHVWANSLNARGHVAGYTDIGGARRAFMWTEEGITDLGSVGSWRGEVFSYATSISDEDVVVGTSSAAAPKGSTSFVYAHGTMFDLDAACGTDLRYVVRANAKGQILAQDSNGYAVLLTPR